MPLMSVNFQAIAFFRDLRTLIRVVFSLPFRSFAIMTGHFSLLPKNAYSSPWVSPVHCVPKKGGMTVIKNDENELVPTRLVTGWRVCLDYRKQNEATRKDHFPLPFMDQMLERLAGNEYYCFLDGFSGYFQIPIDPKDQEKTTFTCPMELLLTNACCLASAMHMELSRDAFRTLKDKLTEASILIAPNWDQPFELMCDASDYAVGAVLG
nr:reverse transcriptase domain-containing protein [Tanacetum cinerariifolium]